MKKLYKAIQQLYKQRFGVLPSIKYVKYISTTCIFIVLWIARNIFLKLLNKARSYPPGPLGLPFLGCLMQFAISPNKFIINLAKNYGQIAYVPILASNNIFINDPKLLRKLYQNEKILDRPPWRVRPTSTFSEINGKIWSKRRQHAYTSVFNVTKTSFVLSHIKECIDKYIGPKLDENHVENKKLWYPAKDISFMALNNIISATYDRIIPENDPFIREFQDWTERIVAGQAIATLFDFMVGFSIKAKWFKWHVIWKVHNEGDELLMQWMRKNGFIINPKKNILRRVNQNEETKNDNENTKVYVDYLISKLNENEMTVDEILSDCQLIVATAGEVTYKATEYALLLTAKYPDIQEMVYNELMDVMKKNNLKQFDFKILNQLHIFRAFIHETLRISNVVPTGAPRMTNRDHIIEIEGKKVVIPRFTIAHQNTYFIHKHLDWNDENKILKEENDKFHLEYWLYVADDGKKKFKVHDNFVMFGVGRRDCVGRSLALKAMYAILGLLMIKYKFSAENDNPNGMNIKQVWGATVLHVDPPIGICVHKR